MTREEAVKMWLAFGSQRLHAYNSRLAPKHLADRVMILNAQDCIDGLIALGLLKVDEPTPAPDAAPSEETRHG